MKKKIIFVDDESNVLQGLKRMLWGMRDEWDLSFAENGEKALEILSHAPFDVIVTDMRMPGMDGAELLSRVMNQYPNTIRMVLSGQSDKELTLKSVGPTHQYLAKPCDSNTLINLIKRACLLRGRIEEKSLKDILSQIDSLPTLPYLYQEILKELRSPNSSINKIGEIIASDISMTTKVLQLVNSAFFGLPQRVSNPIQAVRLLGLDTIRGLVLTVNVFSKFKKTGLKEFSLSQLRDHSLSTALSSREIAREQTKDQKIIDDSFLAGLLHDVGKLILADKFTSKFEESLRSAKEENISLYESEKRIFTATHADVGGYLIGLWGLPQLIVEAVFFHHFPSQCGSINFSPLTALHIADVMEDRFRFPGKTPFLDMEHLSQIGLSDKLPAWEDICRKVAKRVDSYDE